MRCREFSLIRNRSSSSRRRRRLSTPLHAVIEIYICTFSVSLSLSSCAHTRFFLQHYHFLWRDDCLVWPRFTRASHRLLTNINVRGERRRKKRKKEYKKGAASRCVERRVHTMCELWTTSNSHSINSSTKLCSTSEIVALNTFLLPYEEGKKWGVSVSREILCCDYFVNRKMHVIIDCDSDHLVMNTNHRQTSASACSTRFIEGSISIFYR